MRLLSLITAIALIAILGLFDPCLNSMPAKFTTVKHEAVYAARLAQLFWAALYIWLLLKLTASLPMLARFTALSLLGLIPQVIFVQSYVNLDSMGVTMLAYLVWAGKQRSWKHLSLAMTGIAASKLNFYCVGLLPLFLVVEEAGKDLKKLLRLLNQVLLPAGIVAIGWALLNYFYFSGLS